MLQKEPLTSGRDPDLLDAFLQVNLGMSFVAALQAGGSRLHSIDQE